MLSTWTDLALYNVVVSDWVVGSAPILENGAVPVGIGGGCFVTRAGLCIVSVVEVVGPEVWIGLGDVVGSTLTS